MHSAATQCSRQLPESGLIQARFDNFEEIVGRGAAMQRVLEQVETVAPTDATVLILGETGTGKELIARGIHRTSARKHHPFITLNCAAIPTGLLESELFGYEKGAFTGALGQKIGRFELANGGTLFLDEVGDIPLDLQPKLLRALQEKAFERLGGIRTIPIDVRLVAATNRNLDADDGRQTLSKRSLLSTESFSDYHAALARSPRGHSRPRPALHPQVCSRNEPASRNHSAGHHASSGQLALARECA